MDKREELAEYAHDAWSGWLGYMFSKCISGRNIEGEFDGSLVIPPAYLEHWQRQMETPYADLPESEKESDRAEADKMLAICDSDEAQLYQALAFAKSVILSGEAWDETCEQVIDGALRKARGE